MTSLFDTLTDIWIDVVLCALCLIAALGAGWAVLRVRELSKRIDAMVRVLEAAGWVLTPDADGLPTLANALQVRTGGGARHARRDSARSWLTHYATTPGATWTVVASSIITRVVGDDLVKDYFTHVDPERQTEHIAHALNLVTTEGLTAATVGKMAKVHRRVRTDDGDPISGEVYQRVVDHIAGALAEVGVPADAIAELAKQIEPLREAIVMPPVPAPVNG